MKYWAMVLHFYQPPTQEVAITRNVLNFCYLPLLRMLAQKSGYGLTLNLSGCLLVQLERARATEFFRLIKQLIAEGKVEIVGSAMNHPLMPVTHRASVKRQIAENALVLKRLVGVEKTAGFFPPELAVDLATVNLIPHAYVVVDEGAIEGCDPIVKYGEKYLVANNRRIGELLRAYPSRLGVEAVTKMLEATLTVSANDAELFGHHYTERLQVLADLLDSKKVKLITVAQALEKFGDKSVTVTKIQPSTWQNTKVFDLWTRNDLQKKYLALLKTVQGLVHDHELYDLATSSCYLYWLSNWPWWHPGLVEAGAANLRKSVQDARVEGVYGDFIRTMWKYHNSGKVEKNYQKYDEVKRLGKRYNPIVVE